MEFPKSLKADELSDSTSFEDFNFELEIYTVRHDMDNELTTNTLDLTAIIGSSTNRTTRYDLHLAYDGVMYRYSAILVLKEKGTFELRLVSPYDDRHYPAVYDGKCSHKPTEFRCVMNTGNPVDNNINLIKPYLGGNPANWDGDFLQRGSFAFVVK
jgi:hypothetical protein